MRNIENFLSDLSQQEIKIGVEGNKLRCQAPKGLLTPELLAQLAERKVEILRFFRKSTPIESTRICQFPLLNNAFGFLTSLRDPVLLTMYQPPYDWKVFYIITRLKIA